MKNKEHFYKTQIYYIERFINMDDKYCDNQELSHATKQGLKFYIISNETKTIKFGLITTTDFKINEQLNGYNLVFQKINLKNYVNYKISYSKFNEKYLIFQELSYKKKVSKTFIPAKIYLKRKLNENNEVIKYINVYNIHLNRICFYKPDGYLDILKTLRISSIKKLIDKILFNKTNIDHTFKNILKSSLYRFEKHKNNLMVTQSHSIVLTNGATGKTSMLGKTCNILTDTSEAGLFGYYDVKNSIWRAGVVSKNSKPILIDEINEIINKNIDMVARINTSLENGIYGYGKAGNNNIVFNNMFIYAGNITDRLNFEDFVYKISANPETIGRRFCYIVYNNNMPKLNQKFKDTLLKSKENQTLLLNIFSDFITKILDYLIFNKNILSKLKSNKKTLNIIEQYKTLLTQKLNAIELENTIKFFNSYLQTSLENRLLVMALKISIYNNSDLLFNEIIKNNKSLNRIAFSKIYQDTYSIFKSLLQDITFSIDNIISHLKSQSIKSNSERLYNDFKDIKGKFINLLINNIFQLKETNKLINGKGILLENLPNYSNLKYLKRNLKNNKTSTTKINKTLNKFGLIIYKKSEINEPTYYIKALNPNIFKQYQETYNKYILNNDNDNNKDINKNNEDNLQNEVLEEILMEEVDI